LPHTYRTPRFLSISNWTKQALMRSRATALASTTRAGTCGAAPC
jgi:hypothetical protein